MKTSETLTRSDRKMKTSEMLTRSDRKMDKFETLTRFDSKKKINYQKILGSAQKVLQVTGVVLPVF